MGIHDLLPLLRKLAPSAFQPLNGQLESGAAVAIDTPIFMYKFGYAVGTGRQLCARMLRFANELKARNLEPIFVFDGGNLPEKERERERRFQHLCRQSQLQELKQSAIQLRHAEGCEEIEVERSSCPSARPIAEDFQAFKLALEAASIKSCVAQYEAEALCAHLCLTGKVSAMLTEDSDSLAYLAPSVILHWNGEKEEIANAKEACKALGLTENQFQDLCVLMGNDFNCRIKGIGPMKALAMIRKHGSLENALSIERVDNDTASRMRATRHIFATRCYEMTSV